MIRLRRWLRRRRALALPTYLAVATLILLGSAAKTSADAGLPDWLVQRVHQLVVARDDQAAQIQALRAETQRQAVALDAVRADLTTVQTELQQVEARLACQSSLPVDNATVRAVTGRTRAVIGLRPEQARRRIVTLRPGCGA